MMGTRQKIKDGYEDDVVSRGWRRVVQPSWSAYVKRKMRRRRRCEAKQEVSCGKY